MLKCEEEIKYKKRSEIKTFSRNRITHGKIKNLIKLKGKCLESLYNEMGRENNEKAAVR